MTLARLLEIDLKLITREEEFGLAYAESLWREEGSPSDVAPLYRTLEGILGACQREGVRYPPILLRRRKELQRGMWRPVPPPRVLSGIRQGRST